MPAAVHQARSGASQPAISPRATTSKQLSGDIVLVKGTNAKPFDLPFGISHGDRGMRNDQHDAIGIELHFHSLSTPRSGASQPAASACGRAPQSAFSRDRSRSGGGRAKDVATMSQQKMSKQEGSEDVAPSTWRQIWAAKIAQLATKMQRRRRCSDEDAATKRRRCGDEAPQPASSTSSVDPPPSELAADAGLQDAWMRSGGPSAEVAEIASQLIIDRRHRKAVAVQAPVRARGSVAPHVSGALQPASSTLAPAPQRPVPRDAAPVPGDTAQAHGAPQPAMEPGALINQMLLQPATEDPNSLGSSRVAETLNEDMRSFLWAHPEFPLAEAVKLRSVLFSKKQHPVPADLWITGGASGASQPGDHQYVTAGVSETYVLQQLHGVLELRNGWLRQQNLPLHFQMRDQIERPEFLAYARYQYEIQPHQQKRQSEDWQAGGNTKLRNGMRSRWAREQQRRCGSPALWGIVSFTGRFEANYLAKVESVRVRGSVGDSQPDDHDQEKTKIANQARRTLRWAQHLDRKRTTSGANKSFLWTDEDLQLLEQLDSGELLRIANEATRASGHGRLRNQDGTFKDIGTGGLLRTVLDNWRPPVLGDEVDVDDAGMNEEESVHWS